MEKHENKQNYIQSDIHSQITSDMLCPRCATQLLPSKDINQTSLRERPNTKFPAKDLTPERLRESYSEQADWYQWAVVYSQSEAEKVRKEIINLRHLLEFKELELADLEADTRSFGDMVETYRELAGDTGTIPTQETNQEDCFD